MAKSVARRSPQKQIPVAEAKAKVLELIAGGAKVAEACASVGRSPETYRDWQKHDPEFKAALQELRSTRADIKDSGRPELPPFDVFCEQYLKQPLFPHQLRMWDVLEGREPRDILPVFRHDPGTKWESRRPDVPAGRVIINVPPGHAKTTSISINWCTYLIHKDPDIKIIVVCKDQGLAVQILGAVKFRLTSPVYREMHLRFAPDGGWKDPDSSWTQTQIFVQGKGDGEKDPTMQALGIGGRIYGARSDVILLDDAVTLANVNEYDKQRRWLDQEVESRLDGAGLLGVLGTRVAPVDLYSTMRDTVDFDDNKVYTYFSMPAVLDEGDGNPENWVPLWPERFSGKRLRKIRRDEATWALVYQQQDVAEDATFNAKAVQASINMQRFPGPMTANGMGHRPGGMDGLYVVGGLDPATVGNTAMIVAGLDRTTEKRFYLDGFNNKNTTPRLMRDTVKRLTDTYRINEWVIERNAFQRFLTQDDELLQFLRSRGCKLSEHYTTANKFDPDFGIAAMAQLFLTCGEPPSNGGDGIWKKTPEKALIELPNPKQNAWVGELINQYVIWQPSGMKQGSKTDLVMASWFTEIGFNRILHRGRQVSSHMNNPYASKDRLRERHVVNLADYRELLLAEREAV
jgi:hypothetical protein